MLPAEPTASRVSSGNRSSSRVTNEKGGENRGPGASVAIFFLESTDFASLSKL